MIRQTFSFSHYISTLFIWCCRVCYFVWWTWVLWGHHATLVCSEKMGPSKNCASGPLKVLSVTAIGSCPRTAEGTANVESGILASKGILCRIINSETCWIQSNHCSRCVLVSAWSTPFISYIRSIDIHTYVLPCMFLLEALTFSTVYEYRIDIITFQNTFLKISIGCAMCMESTIEPFFISTSTQVPIPGTSESGRMAEHCPPTFSKRGNVGGGDFS